MVGWSYDSDGSLGSAARGVAGFGLAAEHVDSLSETSLWSMSLEETAETLTASTRLVALDRYQLVRDALAGGELLFEQAHVIVRALEELTPDLDGAVLQQAEAELVRRARDHDAEALRILGRRILDVLDPVAGEEREAKQLEREERRAAATVRFTMSDDGQGRVHGRFTLPAAQGTVLRKALTALSAPKHLAATDGSAGERRAAPERMGRAFCEYVERYPSERLPAAGGVNASVVVTLDLSPLLGGLRAASLHTGERISAGLARRLACEAGIIPAVLGGRSQVLAPGRKQRFHTETQRIALGLEQGGCTAAGCDWPPGRCHAHQDAQWSKGGPTSVADGRLLCARHHARAHDPTFTVTKVHGGKVAFTRRT